MKTERESSFYNGHIELLMEVVQMAEKQKISFAPEVDRTGNDRLMFRITSKGYAGEWRHTRLASVTDFHEFLIKCEIEAENNSSSTGNKKPHDDEFKDYADKRLADFAVNSLLSIREKIKGVSVHCHNIAIGEAVKILADAEKEIEDTVVFIKKSV